jgi:hypothetical protein
MPSKDTTAIYTCARERAMRSSHALDDAVHSGVAALSDGAKRQLLRVLDTSVAVSAADSSEEGTAVGQVRGARLWCCHDRTGSARFTRMFVRVRGCGLAERPPGVARRRATLCLHAD